MKDCFNATLLDGNKQECRQAKRDVFPEEQASWQLSSYYAICRLYSNICTTQ